ncbi:tRNA-uridine aminocarboxypropyltransferase [Endozoicomonas acroporae]|uniref:tRNA-uridine aminocarboxypropyltransferase n=1 Tax=Endozoicomonas acroporae TaxID=1701104 RepID=UPI000C78F65A|nr:tRNA-uridine aminocarboxypropyltransferase [Endozoicomonas acroporae]
MPAVKGDCHQCRLPEYACICRLIPKAESAACFWLITHDKEFDKPTNTGKLIQAAIPGTRIFNWSRTSPDKVLLELLDDPDWLPVLLFPREYAVEAQGNNRQWHYNSGSERKVAFIIIDATWQQARKMYRQSPWLHGLNVLSLQPEEPSIYRLRRNRQEQHLCTAEVAARALGELGENTNRQLMEALVQVYCDRYLWARKGQRRDEDSRSLRILEQSRSGAHSGCQ